MYHTIQKLLFCFMCEAQRGEMYQAQSPIWAWHKFVHNYDKKGRNSINNVAHGPAKEY